MWPTESDIVLDGIGANHNFYVNQLLYGRLGESLQDYLMANKDGRSRICKEILDGMQRGTTRVFRTVMTDAGIAYVAIDIDRDINAYQEVQRKMLQVFQYLADMDG